MPNDPTTASQIRHFPNQRKSDHGRLPFQLRQASLTVAIEVDFLFGMQKDHESAFPKHWWLTEASVSTDDPRNSNLSSCPILIDEIRNPCNHSGGDCSCLYPWLLEGLWKAAKVFANFGGEALVKPQGFYNEDDNVYYGCIIICERFVTIPEDGHEMSTFSNGVLGEDEDPEDWNW
jgi:hypothetical protein